MKRLLLALALLYGLQIEAEELKGSADRGKAGSDMDIKSLDAHWSGYGKYLNGLLKKMRTQWHRIIKESGEYAPKGCQVTVTFEINSKGETDIIKVEDQDCGKKAVFACVNAIQYTQPYRKWPPKMISALGEKQTITITFVYQ